jgi:hypothetical protein
MAENPLPDKRPLRPEDRPTREDLDGLLGRLGPQIARLLRRWRVPEAEATTLVSDALIGIAYRWSRIRDRERWVLRAIEKEARSRSKSSQEEKEE